MLSTILGNAYVRVRPDMDGFDNDVKRSVRSTMASAAKIAAIAVAGAAAFKGAQVLKDSVRASSDLNESLNAVNVTFGKSAAGITKLGESAARTLGLSQAEFNGLAVQFSNFATTVAGDGGDVTKVMADLTGRASDFASVMNLDVAEAATLFQSGLAGETEPLRRYGIDLSAAAVESYALANGIGDGTGELSEQEKVLARYGLIMEQTSKTQGDFANTSDGLANQQRILKSTFEDSKAAIGSAFTPLAEAILPKVTELLSGMTEDLKANMPQVQATMKEIGDGVGEFIDKLGGWEGIKANLEDTTATLKAEWPGIKDTFENVGAAVERVGQFTGAMWDAFKSLPPEVQQLVAMFAVAQKTGVISVAFSAADAFKKLMTVQAGTVYVNGVMKPVGGGGAGAAAGAAAGGVAGALGGVGPTVGIMAAVWRGFDLYGKVKDLFAGDMGLGDFFKDVVLGPVGAGIVSWLGETTATARRVAATAFGQMRDDVLGAVTGIFVDVHNWFQGIGWTIQNATSTAWRVVVTNFQMMKDAAVGKAQELWSGVTGKFDELKTKVGEIFSGMVTNIGNIWNGVTDKVKAPIRSMFSWIDRNMIGPLNSVLGKFSASITLGTLTDKIGAYADGGYVTGPGGPRDDRVPAMLSNGEFVMNAEATRRNRVMLEALNAGKQGFGIGGILPDWLNDVVAAGASASVRFFANPALDVLERLFGGEWSPNVVIAGMRHVVGQVDNWARREDASVTGEYKGPRGAVQRPLNAYVVTSEWMRSGSDPRHFGIDLGAPTGTPVYSIAAGRVVPMTSANIAATGGYGIMATVDHGGLKSLYAHMSQLAVKVGDLVSKGDLLGRVGSTGQSTGPHLHFETHQGGGPVNPRRVMAFDSGGQLEPGWTSVYNGTGKPEPVFTDAQWQQMSKAKEGATYNVQISPVTPASPDEVAAALRRVDLLYGVV